MTLLIVIATFIATGGIARLLLGEFSKDWYELVDVNYTTCGEFHNTMAAKPWYVKVNERLEEKGI